MTDYDYEINDPDYWQAQCQEEEEYGDWLEHLAEGGGK